MKFENFEQPEEQGKDYFGGLFEKINGSDKDTEVRIVQTKAGQPPRTEMAVAR